MKIYKLFYFILYLPFILSFPSSSLTSLSLIHYNSNNLLYINNITYRESTDFNNKSYFPILIKKIHNYSNNVIFTTNINNFKYYKFISGLHNIIISNNKTPSSSSLYNFESLEFTIDYDNTLVHLITKLSIIPMNKNQSATLLLYLNNNILFQQKIYNKFTHLYNKILTLNQGNYSLFYKVFSNKGLWCSCPENKNGFFMSRFLSKWEYYKQSNKSIKSNNYIIDSINTFIISLKHNWNEGDRTLDLQFIRLTL
tara:strand:+ start:72 stop:833 length:762 start_codon:yes stop_codon:yes gene_type:complete